MECIWLVGFEGCLGPAECITATEFEMSRDAGDGQICSERTQV